MIDCVQNVLAMSLEATKGDNIREQLLEEDVQAVYARYSKKAHKVFAHYAHSERKEGKEGAAAAAAAKDGASMSLNIRSYEHLLHDLNVLDNNHVSRRVALAAFALAQEEDISHSETGRLCLYFNT